MESISIAFKKLLGKGRAWLCHSEFTSELLDIFISPLVDIKNRLINLKYVHFPSTYTDENNVANGEELFAIKNYSDKTLEERAANVEANWRKISGYTTFQQIEGILHKKGLPVKVVENIPLNADYFRPQIIANGFLNIAGDVSDPIEITDDKNVFFIIAGDFLTEEQENTLIESVVKVKQAHLVIYFMKMFLRKKEIHHVLTKNQMQAIKKKRYCNVGVH